MIKNSFFSRIFFYAGLESVIYQIILCTHQIMLFKYCDSSLYGKSGALFSGIFLLALYLNFGLDSSLGNLFKIASENKSSFRSLILKQFWTMLITPFALVGIYIFSKNIWIENPATLLLVCGALVLIESARKTVRTLLHLALLQRLVAFVEIATLGIYVATVWYSIVMHQTLNLYTIFTPMLASSSIALCIYLYRLRLIYTCLPDGAAADYPARNLVYMRLKNSMYQIIHSFYSSNFLIFSIAQLYGFELAALLKIVSFCTYSINYVVQHAFGTAAGVLFAHFKDSSTAKKQHYFEIVRARLAYLLLILPIMLLGYHWYLYLTFPNMCSEQVHILSLFMILLFSENITIAHEQYYIVEGRAGLLIACNALLLIPGYIIRYTLCGHSPVDLLYLLILVRISIFLCLHYIDSIKDIFTRIRKQKYILLFAEK